MGFLIKHRVLANLYFLSFGTKEMFSCFVFKKLKVYQLTSLPECGFAGLCTATEWITKEKKKEREAIKSQGMERSDHSKEIQNTNGCISFLFRNSSDSRGHSTPTWSLWGFFFFFILKENSFALGIKTPNWSHQDFVLWLSLSSFSHKDLVTKVQVRYPVPKTFLLDNVESGGLSAYPTLWASKEAWREMHGYFRQGACSAGPASDTNKDFISCKVTG